jgi:hypothetical protein
MTIDDEEISDGDGDGASDNKLSELDFMLSDPENDNDL